MKVILKVLEGPVEHESIVIRDGEQLTIGREDNADITVPDQQMSSVHLQIENADDQCFVQDLRSTNGTFLNDQQLTKKSPLSNGDTIRCGTTRFQVELPDSAAAAPPPAAAEPPTVVPPPATSGTQPPPQTSGPPPADGEADTSGVLEQTRGFSEDSAAAIVSRFSLGDLPLKPEPTETPEQFARRLIEADETGVEPVRFLSYALPKRPAVWWATRCVREVAPEPTKKDTEVLAAAEQWVANPTDEIRRQAMNLAQKQECETAACWTGIAAFWSHGSMTPPDVPAVPPKDDLTGKAVSGALSLAAVINHPERAPQRRVQFCDIAMAVASGENTWEQ